MNLTLTDKASIDEDEWSYVATLTLGLTEPQGHRGSAPFERSYFDAEGRRVLSLDSDTWSSHQLRVYADERWRALLAGEAKRHAAEAEAVAREVKRKADEATQLLQLRTRLIQLLLQFRTRRIQLRRGETNRQRGAARRETLRALGRKHARAGRSWTELAIAVLADEALAAALKRRYTTGKGRQRQPKIEALAKALERAMTAPQNSKK